MFIEKYIRALSLLTLPNLGARTFRAFGVNIALILSLLLNLSASANAQMGPMPLGESIPQAEIAIVSSPIDENTNVNSMLMHITGAKSANDAIDSVLKNLSPEQLGNLSVISEDETVEQHIADLYPNATNPKTTPAFIPFGALGDQPGSEKILKGSAVGRVWKQGKNWARSVSKPLKDPLVERWNYITGEGKGFDAFYLVTSFGMSAKGWVVAAATAKSAMRIHATLGGVMNLGWSTGWNMYTMIPNRFSKVTKWTTRKIMDATGRSKTATPNVAYQLAGNISAQFFIKATSSLITALCDNGIVRGMQTLDFRILESVVGASLASTSTDFFVQRTYRHLDDLKIKTESELLMTQYLLRRAGSMMSAASNWFAPTKVLLTLHANPDVSIAMIHTAWIVQGISVAAWVAMDLSLPYFSKFAETSKFVNLVFKGELALTDGVRAAFNKTTAIPRRAMRRVFHSEPCNSLFISRF